MAGSGFEKGTKLLEWSTAIIEMGQFIIDDRSQNAKAELCAMTARNTSNWIDAS